MHIEHFAIYTSDLERLVAFYSTYFGAVVGPKYTNPRRQFQSYFLSFASGARLEVMTLPELDAPQSSGYPLAGYTHLAMALGSEAAVDAMTARLRSDGYVVASGPRRTGDGYYESVVLDPDGNQIELTV